MTASDPEINRGVRQVLTRHWYDLSKTNFASRRGIVRMIGELRKVGRGQDGQVESAQLETLDTELRRLKGVQRVHFDLDNWRRNDDGEWVPVEDAARDERADRELYADGPFGE